ncbi:hypothetical protein MLD52_20490 [Puniceicoccaceae bacterium K14]|nr:hypothetical protein [Puniceicoccaceae bacterium K14]
MNNNTAKKTHTAESLRLQEDKTREKNWKRWGPYLAERQWGTVREDYSPDGDAWNSFPFDHADKRAYRWGEDGLLGFSDRQARLCFGLALWNENDCRIKERLFGLNGNEGNHGEDCKELYYYLDSTPTHSYSKALYKYPQAAYPYDRLKKENQGRDKELPEYEILGTGIFDESRYFDIQAEYAKGGPDDLLIRITATNRGSEAAPLHLLPKLWYRNTWIWGCEHEGCTLKPQISKISENKLQLEHETLGTFYFEATTSSNGVTPQFLFTENETNTQALYGQATYTAYTKDAFNRWLVKKQADALKPDGKGTISATYYHTTIPAGESVSIDLRLYSEEETPAQTFGASFNGTLEKRQTEANAFYSSLGTDHLNEDQLRVQRQAYAGLLWTKQFFHYSVKDWLKGDSDIATPSEERLQGRNHAWPHLFNRDIISMPDKWEYPWYAAWDLAFHMIPFADIDIEFAKDQLILFLREWYMHPNGQIPAYEWALGDVNPPVHAWACWEVYQKSKSNGDPDLAFLERAFHKLMLNFTWWVNRKDPEGNNLFAGGFLGLDNIGLFDRSHTIPGGKTLMQADGTAWMAFYCSNMLTIALELAHNNRSYSDVASKFFEHFITIIDAINSFGHEGLWDEEEGFYHDQLRDAGTDSSSAIPVKIRSLVGLLPLCATSILDLDELNKLPLFKKRMEWYLEHRKDLAEQIAYDSKSERYLLAIPSKEKLKRLLAYILDEEEFLSPHGIRSLSRFHKDSPVQMDIESESYKVEYTPGDSDSYLFGGNSNWRGPVWFPLNYLIVQSLKIYHEYYGDDFKVEYPKNSGKLLNLHQCADAIGERLTSLFLSQEGKRPCHGEEERYATDPHFKDLILFYEYFHGDTGRGLGASHQTGWTALAASLLK